MSKIQLIEELLVTYRLRKEVMSEAEERLMDWQERVNNAADDVSETVTELQELGFDVAAFEDGDTINDLIDEEEVEASEGWGSLSASDIPPMPEGDGWKRNTGVQPLAGNTQVETIHEDGSLQHGGASDHFWELDDERINKIIWYRKAQPEPQAEPAPAPEAVDHFAEATAQIEDQAESESTDPDGELPEWALLTAEENAQGWKQVEFTGEPPEGIEDWTNYEVLFGSRCGFQWVGCSWGWHTRDAFFSDADADATIIGYRLKSDTESTETEAGVETVTEEPEASSDEEPVENEPRHLATYSSVSDEPKPFIDDTQGVTSYTVRGVD